MIDLYGMGSPNVIKIAILLEESATPYRLHFVDVMRGAGREPDFLALNPFGKVPVIVDEEGPAGEEPIFESGAILTYLADSYAPAFLPRSGPARWAVLKWLTAQVASVGPVLGQLNHFQLVASEGESYASRRFQDQARRIYRVLDDRLGESPWLGGADYSIADIALYPWMAYLERHGFSRADHPRLVEWRDRVDERSAVKAAVARVNQAAAADPKAQLTPTDAELDRFFDRSQPGPAADLAAYMALGPTITTKV